MYRVESLPISIPIGRQGENHAMKIEIDCSSFLAEWPQATITAMLRRNVAENPYILVTSIDSNGILTWEPTAHDTGIEGDGQIEIRAVENDVLAKSVTAIVCVERSLTPPEPDTPIDWVEDIKSDIAQSVTSAANSASDAAKSAAAAQESAAAAAGSAAAAQSSANAAAGSASAASKSAASAAGSADAASGSASEAAQSAAAADKSAKASAASAAEAAGALDNVNASADAAAGSARAAAESASAAADSKSGAAQAATDAEGSATAAASSASQSAAARDEAQAAQTAAGASASDAAGSATAAAGSKDAAAQSASAAAASAEAAEKAAQDAAGIIDDTRVGTDNVWSAKHTADMLLPMQKVTGNPAVIETLEGYPLELNASWEPKQEGSGTPSPDNVRPITGGRDSVTFTRAEDGASKDTTFDKKYYGGVLTDKKLKITREIATISSCNKAQVLDNVVRGEIGLKPLAATAKSGNAISDYLPEKVNYAEDAEGVYTNQSIAYIKINKGRLVSADLAGLNEYLNAHPLTVAYKLMAPQEIEVGSANDLPALAGTNTISTDADAVTITAPTPPQTTASAAEAQAAKLDYVAMMADVDVDDLTAVDDAGADTGVDADMPTDIEGSEMDGKQEV